MCIRDSRFYDAMREFSAIGNNIHQISVKANARGFIDTQKLNSELERLHKMCIRDSGYGGFTVGSPRLPSIE